MGDSALGRIRNDLADNPATERLKEELRRYLTARAEDAVTRLGRRLGEGVSRLAEPSAGRGGLTQGLAKGLRKGGEALGEGKSPARAALTAGPPPSRTP